MSLLLPFIFYNFTNVYQFVKFMKVFPLNELVYGIMLFILPIMLLSNIPKFSLLCSI